MRQVINAIRQARPTASWWKSWALTRVGPLAHTAP
jgi:hypothetical protein